MADLFFDVLDVGTPLFLACLQGAVSQLVGKLMQLGVSEPNGPLRYNVVVQVASAPKHVTRHFRSRLRRADERDEILKLILPKTKQVLHNPYVKVVLAKWVLKLRLVAAHNLRPTCLVLPTEDPTGHILGFDHEYAEP